MSPGTKPHGLTSLLKKPVIAGQSLQEFIWGCQRALGLKAEVPHTCRERGSQSLKEGGES